MRRSRVSSSAIESIGYDEKNRNLDVEFVTGRVYRYLDVEPETAVRFLEASSKGRFLNAHVRDEYEFFELRPERRRPKR